MSKKKSIPSSVPKIATPSLSAAASASAQRTASLKKSEISSAQPPNSSASSTTPNPNHFYRRFLATPSSCKKLSYFLHFADAEHKIITWRRFLELLVNRDSEGQSFRDFLIQTLQDCDFVYYSLEFSPVSSFTLDEPFEAALIECTFDAWNKRELYFFELFKSTIEKGDICTQESLRTSRLFLIPRYIGIGGHLLSESSTATPPALSKSQLLEENLSQYRNVGTYFRSCRYAQQNHLLIGLGETLNRELKKYKGTEFWISSGGTSIHYIHFQIEEDSLAMQFPPFLASRLGKIGNNGKKSEWETMECVQKTAKSSITSLSSLPISSLLPTYTAASGQIRLDLFLEGETASRCHVKLCSCISHADEIFEAIKINFDRKSLGVQHPYFLEAIKLEDGGRVGRVWSFKKQLEDLIDSIEAFVLEKWKSSVKGGHFAPRLGSNCLVFPYLSEINNRVVMFALSRGVPTADNDTQSLHSSQYLHSHQNEASHRKGNKIRTFGTSNGSGSPTNLPHFAAPRPQTNPSVNSQVLHVPPTPPQVQRRISTTGTLISSPSVASTNASISSCQISRTGAKKMK